MTLSWLLKSRRAPRVVPIAIKAIGEMLDAASVDNPYPAIVTPSLIFANSAGCERRDLRGICTAAGLAGLKAASPYKVMASI